MQEVVINIGAMTAIVAGVVEILKKTLPGVKDYAEAVALLAGVLLYLPQDLSYEGAIIGLIIGLSSQGLYSTTKKAKHGYNR